MQTHSYKEQLHAPFDWYRQMRATQPVYRDPEFNQAWHVFRYADVSRVLSEYATFSAEDRRMNPDAQDLSPISSSILRMDPPRHNQLRSLVSQAFTPRMVAQLEPRIRAICNRLIGAMHGQRTADLVRTHLPATPQIAWPLLRQRVGAEVCFVNHAGGPGPVAGFVAAAREVGGSLSFIPCVAVFHDDITGAVLQGLHCPVIDPRDRAQCPCGRGLSKRQRWLGPSAVLFTK